MAKFFASTSGSKLAGGLALGVIRRADHYRKPISKRIDRYSNGGAPLNTDLGNRLQEKFNTETGKAKGEPANN